MRLFERMEKIKKSNLHITRSINSSMNIAEYYSSSIYQMYSRMITYAKLWEMQLEGQKSNAKG